MPEITSHRFAQLRGDTSNDPEDLCIACDGPRREHTKPNAPHADSEGGLHGGQRLKHYLLRRTGGKG